MKRHLLIVCLCLAPCAMLHARHYFELGARIGLGGLVYDCNYGHTSPGYHASFDLGWLYRSPYWFAIRAGASIEAASSVYKKAGYQDQYATIDVENMLMEVRYDIGRLRETHRYYAVSFPLQIGITRRGFTGLIGPRFSVPFGGTWHETVSNAALAVYYPRYNNLVEESYPLAASRDFDMKAEGNLSLPKWRCSLSGELTYDFLLSSQYGKTDAYLSVGLYFDVWLITAPTTLNNDRWGILHLTDTRDGFPLSRIMTPVLEAWREEAPLVNSLRAFDVGIKAAVHLTAAPKQKHLHPGCNCYE